MATDSYGHNGRCRPIFSNGGKGSRASCTAGPWPAGASQPRQRPPLVLPPDRSCRTEPCSPRRGCTAGRPLPRLRWISLTPSHRQQSPIPCAHRRVLGRKPAGWPDVPSLPATRLRATSPAAHRGTAEEAVAHYAGWPRSPPPPTSPPTRAALTSAITRDCQSITLGLKRPASGGTRHGPSDLSPTTRYRRSTPL
jgi:hypothetical protein